MGVVTLLDNPALSFGVPCRWGYGPEGIDCSSTLLEQLVSLFTTTAWAELHTQVVLVNRKPGHDEAGRNIFTIEDGRLGLRKLAMPTKENCIHWNIPGPTVSGIKLHLVPEFLYIQDFHTEVLKWKISHTQWGNPEDIFKIQLNCFKSEMHCLLFW